MNTTELPQLKTKVQQHPFPLLFATISGAHLYGFPSSDSDFDLRGAHVLPLKHVIGLHPGQETLDQTSVDDGMELDLVTHDIAKFFRMMLKKNGYVIEQVMSPLVVYSSSYHEELISLVPSCLTKHHVHHYLGFAKTQWDLFLKTASDTNAVGPRVKPLLYVYRVLLTGIHLMQTGIMECNLQTLNQHHQCSEVKALLELKRQGEEKQVVDPCDLTFHEKQVERLTEKLQAESARSSLPEFQTASNAINDLLIRIRMDQSFEHNQQSSSEIRKPTMDVQSHNKSAWDQKVSEKDQWTQAVSSDVIDAARSGKVSIVLTPIKPVPSDWFPTLNHAKTLCLAAAGGQQAPVLAAAGADVIVLDNSPKQLQQDRFVADRNSLSLTTVEGDMADLSQFADNTFDLIFHPCSNCFVPDVLTVWKECHRVLKPGGILLAGFTNSVRYIFDDERKENGNLEVKYALPYSDLDYLNEPHLQKMTQAGEALEFSHTLEEQIGGQLQAGLMLTDMFEDRWAAEANDPLSKFMDTYIATRAIKPKTDSA